MVIETINNYCTMLSKITLFVIEERLSSKEECLNKLTREIRRKENEEPTYFATIY